MNPYDMRTICAVLSVTCVECGKRQELDVGLSVNHPSMTAEVKPEHIYRALDHAGFVCRKVGWVHKECCREEDKKAMKGE